MHLCGPHDLGPGCGRTPPPGPEPPGLLPTCRLPPEKRPRPPLEGSSGSLVIRGRGARDSLPLGTRCKCPPPFRAQGHGFLFAPGSARSASGSEVLKLPRGPARGQAGCALLRPRTRGPAGPRALRRAGVPTGPGRSRLQPAPGAPRSEDEAGAAELPRAPRPAAAGKPGTRAQPRQPLQPEAEPRTPEDLAWGLGREGTQNAEQTSGNQGKSDIQGSVP